VHAWVELYERRTLRSNAFIFAIVPFNRTLNLISEAPVAAGQSTAGVRCNARDKVGLRRNYGSHGQAACATTYKACR